MLPSPALVRKHFQIPDLPQEESDDEDEDEDEDSEDGHPPGRRLITRASVDPAGNPAWPPPHPPQLAQPSRLFFHGVMKTEFPDQQFEDVEPEVTRRWTALAETEKAVYAARAEALRNQAWDEFEETNAERARGETATREVKLQLPGYQEFIDRQLEDLEATVQPRGPSHPRGPAWLPPSRDTPRPAGQKAWPIHVNFGRFEPFALFWDHQRAQHPGQELRDVWEVDDVAREVARRLALSMQARKAYETESERLRQEVWDESDEVERRRARGDWSYNPPYRQHP